MVVRIDLRLPAQFCRQSAALGQGYTVPQRGLRRDLSVVGPHARDIRQMLVQRATFGNVYQLHSATHAKNGFSSAAYSLVQRQIKLVAVFVYFA